MQRTKEKYIYNENQSQGKKKSQKPKTYIRQNYHYYKNDQQKSGKC